MSEGASSAPAPAAGGTATPGTAQPSTQNAQNVGPASDKSDKNPTKADAGDWNDENEREAIEAFQKIKNAPWAKHKYKGEERAIDSKEVFLEMLGKSQQATALSRTAEQAKKDREEAAKMKSEAQQLLELRNRARQGDEEARKMLLGESPEEVEAREREWQQLSPQMRQLLVERQQMAEQLTQLQQQQQQALRQQQEQQRQAEVNKRREVVLGFSKQLIPSLGLSEGTQESILDDTASAIDSLAEEGFTIDELTPAVIQQRLAQMREHMRGDYFQKLSWPAKLQMLEGDLTQLSDADLERLPMAFRTRVSRHVAAKLRGQKAQPPTQTNGHQQEERRESPPQILPLHRWSR